jgi:hypothetical protein
VTRSAKSTDRFELGVLANDSVDQPVSLAELLERADAGDPLPDVDLDQATLFFESDGRDWMPLHWVLGDLEDLGLQFEAAAARLRSGKVAIVRSSVDDRLDVDYFLFSPAAGAITVTTFQPPEALRFVYPHYAGGADLYEWVEDNLADLADRALDDENPSDIAGATMPSEALVAALEREATRVERVVALPGLRRE